VYPAPDGHLVLTDSADAFVPSDGFVELLPRMDPNYHADEFVCSIDGLLVGKKTVFKQSVFPSTRIATWTGMANRKRVQLSYVPDDDKYHTLLDATLRRSLPDALPTLTATLQGEEVFLRLSDRTHLRTAYLYEGEECLGQLDKGEDAFLVHTRFLVPGKH